MAIRIQLSSDSVEIFIDPHGDFARVLNDTVPSNEPTPEQILSDLEDLLIQQYGMTLHQARRSGLFD